jgi:hypothetical protein
MLANAIKGYCLCRTIVFEYVEEPKWTVYCHCESCRRATSSPIITWISVARESFRFTQGEPRYYQSSPGVKRGFCAVCGSPLTYESARFPGEIHLYASSLADPTAVSPSRHVFVEEQLPWIEIADELPRYAKTGSRGMRPVRWGPKRF